VVKLTQIFTLIIVLVWLCGEVSARSYIIIGGLTMGYDYKDRKDEPSQTINETKSDEEDDGLENVREISVSPLLVIDVKGIKDGVEIRYNPKLSYDHELETDDISHNLSIDLYRQLSKHWLIQASNHFNNLDRQDTGSIEDDSEEKSTTTVGSGQSEERDPSDKYGRRRYWSNKLSISTSYTYLEDSDIVLGYGYDVLRNEETEDEEDNYRDYTVHDAYLSLSYRFNPMWKVTGVGQYMEGDYFPSTLEEKEETENSEEDAQTVFLKHTYGALMIDTRIWPTHPLSLEYNYHNYNYDDADRDDIVIQNLTLGWKKAFFKHLDLSLSGGPTLVMPEERDQYWGYNGQTVLGYRFESGSFRLVLEKGYEKNMFSSVDEETLSDYYVASAALTLQPLEDLSVVLSGSYRYDDKEQLSLADEETADETQEDESYYQEQYSVGARVNYQFYRWYTATVGYRYTDFDSEQEDEDHQESLVHLSLQTQKELWRW